MFPPIKIMEAKIQKTENYFKKILKNVVVNG